MTCSRPQSPRFSCAPRSRLRCLRCRNSQATDAWRLAPNRNEHVFPPPGTAFGRLSGETCKVKRSPAPSTRVTRVTRVTRALWIDARSFGFPRLPFGTSFNGTHCLLYETSGAVKYRLQI